MLTLIQQEGNREPQFEHAVEKFTFTTNRTTIASDTFLTPDLSISFTKGISELTDTFPGALLLPQFHITKAA